jgi:hypothetical protein
LACQEAAAESESRIEKILLVSSEHPREVISQLAKCRAAVSTSPGSQKKKTGYQPHRQQHSLFTILALRRVGLDPARDVTFIQAGGELERLAALLNASVDAQR